MMQPKLGATYSLFSGEELLEGSLSQIRAHVDYINVVYQKRSWFGDTMSDAVLPLLERLTRARLIDQVIEYVLPERIDTGRLHRLNIAKKTLGLKDLKRVGCTHVLFMDVDEFYVPDEFARAKAEVFSRGLTHTACPIYDYNYAPIYRKRDAAPYSVPFIQRIDVGSHLTRRHGYPCVVDPLRALLYHNPWTPWHYATDRFFYFNTIAMHHMTGIRFDVEKKFKNTVTNATAEGRAFVANFREHFLREGALPEEKLLAEGYIKVDDRFSLMPLFPSAT